MKPESTSPAAETEGFDFGGARFDFDDPRDRRILSFILSQALYGEATGVYCGLSLYSAHSLEAAQFYVRQARQELAHLKLFADMFQQLDLQPSPGHWVLRVLSSHNHYYPLKVLMEHAIGEGLVLDVFKDVLLQTLPEGDPRSESLRKKLNAICREEAEHVAWGERETQRLLTQKPYLRPAFYGLVQLQLALVPFLVKPFAKDFADHAVLKQLPAYLEHVRRRVETQGRRLGYVPEKTPSKATRGAAVALGAALYLRSQLARPKAVLPRTYLRELGFDTGSPK